MRRSLLSASLTAILALMATTPVAIAQTDSEKGDPRVKQALDEAGMPYVILGDSGQFKVSVTLQNKRKQHVFINSETQKFGDLEIRRIHSAAYRSPGAFPPAIANQLLMDSNKKKIGNWQTVLDGKKTHYGVFTMKVDADLPASQLLKLMMETLATADKMEAELTGKDIF
ncbi:MAG: hypothetical protein AAF329_08210 [Cyanobacteria bacterium P01_A01_bin.17]